MTFVRLKMGNKCNKVKLDEENMNEAGEGTGADNFIAQCKCAVVLKILQ